MGDPERPPARIGDPNGLSAFRAAPIENIGRKDPRVPGGEPVCAFAADANSFQIGFGTAIARSRAMRSSVAG